MMEKREKKATNGSEKRAAKEHDLAARQAREVVRPVHTHRQRQRLNTHKSIARFKWHQIASHDVHALKRVSTPWMGTTANGMLVTKRERKDASVQVLICDN